MSHFLLQPITNTHLVNTYVHSTKSFDDPPADPFGSSSDNNHFVLVAGGHFGALLTDSATRLTPKDQKLLFDLYFKLTARLGRFYFVKYSPAVTNDLFVEFKVLPKKACFALRRSSPENDREFHKLQLNCSKSVAGHGKPSLFFCTVYGLLVYEG